MRLSRAVARARNGLPVLHAPSGQQTPKLTRAASSLLSSAPAATSASLSAISPQPRKLLLSSNTTTTRTLPIRTARRHYASPSTGPLNKTALYDLHLANGAKMVPFGGFEMPVQYSGLGVSASHHWTRNNASLFDVGHMVQHFFSGPGAAAFLERLTPGSIAALPPHRSTLSALLWPGTGGIVDDTIITRLPDDPVGEPLFYVVTNAACRDKDLAYLDEQKAAWDGPTFKHIVPDERGLVALQGPLSQGILESLAATDLKNLYFGQSRYVTANINGSEVTLLVSRGGYTGEDGFEISIPTPEATVAVTRALLESAGPEKLQLAGLGARDSLRLEAGMCLYGHDLDDTTTPVEGSLRWIVGRDRRGTTELADGAFHGAVVVLAQLTPKSKGGRGVERHRVGLVVEGAPAREGAEIWSVGEEAKRVGVVTSGCPSPTLGKNIAMGYVADGLHKAGTELQVLVRGRRQKATVEKMPFVPAKYWKEAP
ncbi:glycine cleavage system T protein [Biscogniauxia sp. FL1348]|nr:glycine cleavage system T protein [Biscogniauxia sp. FL1348]